jgi:hypothetical protein
LIFRAWAAGAIIYVLAAMAVSAAPLRAAFRDTRAAVGESATYDTLASTGRSASAKVKLREVVIKQVAIVIAPPLLLLWFGWDLWFAVAGFFDRRQDQNAS